MFIANRDITSGDFTVPFPQCRKASGIIHETFAQKFLAKLFTAAANFLQLEIICSPSRKFRFEAFIFFAFAQN